MSISNDTRERLKIALTKDSAGNEVADAIDAAAGGASVQRFNLSYTDFVAAGGSDPTVTVMSIPANSMVTCLVQTTQSWVNSDGDSIDMDVGTIANLRAFGFLTGVGAAPQEVNVNVEGANTRVFLTAVDLIVRLTLDGGSGDASDLTAGALSLFVLVTPVPAA